MERPVEWVGTSLKDLRGFPGGVQDEIGFILGRVQLGKRHHKLKPLKGKAMQGITEIRSDYRTDTYRAVYTAQLGKTIYVLHCFQKKSKKGVQTPRRDEELIKSRFRTAQQLAEEKPQ